MSERMHTIVNDPNAIVSRLTAEFEAEQLKASQEALVKNQEALVQQWVDPTDRQSLSDYSRYQNHLAKMGESTYSDFGYLSKDDIYQSTMTPESTAPEAILDRRIDALRQGDMSTLSETRNHKHGVDALGDSLKDTELTSFDLVKLRQKAIESGDTASVFSIQNSFVSKMGLTNKSPAEQMAAMDRLAALLARQKPSDQKPAPAQTPITPNPAVAGPGRPGHRRATRPAGTVGSTATAIEAAPVKREVVDNKVPAPQPPVEPKPADEMKPVDNPPQPEAPQRLVPETKPEPQPKQPEEAKSIEQIIKERKERLASRNMNWDNSDMPDAKKKVVKNLGSTGLVAAEPLLGSMAAVSYDENAKYGMPKVSLNRDGVVQALQTGKKVVVETAKSTKEKASKVNKDVKANVKDAKANVKAKVAERKNSDTAAKTKERLQRGKALAKKLGNKAIDFFDGGEPEDSHDMDNLYGAMDDQTNRQMADSRR